MVQVRRSARIAKTTTQEKSKLGSELGHIWKDVSAGNSQTNTLKDKMAKRRKAKGNSRNHPSPIPAGGSSFKHSSPKKKKGKAPTITATNDTYNLFSDVRNSYLETPSNHPLFNANETVAGFPVPPTPNTFFQTNTLTSDAICPQLIPGPEHHHANAIASTPHRFLI